MPQNFCHTPPPGEYKSYVSQHFLADFCPSDLVN